MLRILFHIFMTIVSHGVWLLILGVVYLLNRSRAHRYETVSHYRRRDRW